MGSAAGNSINRRSALKAGLAAAAATIAGGGTAKIVQGAGAAKTEPVEATGALNPFSSYSKPVVETSSGKIRGYIANGILTFKGVPYGASTGGSGRFLPPATPQPWTGALGCLNYGTACPTLSSFMAGEEDRFLLYRISGPQGYSENCLRLNLWTPAADKRKRPVMVFMHGGGFTVGCSNDLLSYDGTNLAKRHDVVAITHNHRLNVFGYLNLAEMGEKYADSGNVGLLDLVAVLEWVRDNVSNFGGDPNNVTVFGQSGGGGKVGALMAMPAAKGLFHRAIVESGATGSFQPPDGKLGAAVVEGLGISRANIDEIQTVPTERLIAATISAVAKISPPNGDGGAASISAGFRPAADGRTIPAGSWGNDAPSVSANVPLIVGTNLNEMVSGLDNPDTDFDDAELMNRLQKQYRDKAADVAAAYRREHSKETPFGIWAAISAAGMRRGAIGQAAKKARLNAALAYNYVYAWRTPALDGRPGTFHSAEIAMVFDNSDLCVDYFCGSAEGKALATAMSGAWTQFARTGNPNHPGIPAWHPYSQESPSTMVFNAPSELKQDFEGAGLRLIAKSQSS